MDVPMTTGQTDYEERWKELAQLHEDALALLAELDRLGLYQAGAYVSMAIDVMRRRRPDLDSCE